MVNESFIDSCFSILLSKSHLRGDKSVFRDILEVIDFYKSKESIDIPLQLKNKFDCLRKLCELRLNGTDVDNAVESVTEVKFSNLYDFLHTKKEEDLSDDIITRYIRDIKLRRKLKYVFNNYDSLSKFLENLKNNSFESVEDLVENYESFIRRSYTDLSEISRSEALESASTLDLVNDSCASILDIISSKYSKVQKVPSGFYNLDKDALFGGFEPSRVYILGGGTGSGKSTLLNNIIVNNTLSRSNKYYDLIDGSEVEERNEKEQIFIYVTLENTLDEAFLRTYQPLFNLTTEDVLREIREGVDIETKFKEEMRKNNVNVIMRYYGPNTISFLDIRSLLDEVRDKNPNSEIAAVLVDYLELLNPEIRSDLYRLDLGRITVGAKSLAVDYNVPVIMPTQLNRSVYRSSSTGTLKLDQMGESIKIAENADCVMLQIKDEYEPDLVHFKVDKNRAGRGNVGYNFKVKWDSYRFYHCHPVSNVEESEEGSSSNNNQRRNRDDLGNGSNSI